MIRILPLFLLLLAACSKSGELATVEDAEAYAQAHGVLLTEKKEDTEQAVAPRAFHYMVDSTVKVGITQFASADGAANWKKMMDDSPLMGGGVRIQKGPVVFLVWGATDAERQKVVDALK
jgi:hypothetical protein